MEKISCSIVLYQHKPDFLAPLVNLILQSEICDKLYLIDNSPTNALVVLATSPKIEYIFNNKNLGYGAGHNIALKKAMGAVKYHVVINPDIFFKPGTLEKLFSYMEQHPQTGHVMPKVINEDGSLQYVCKLIPTPADLIFRRFLPSALTEKRAKRFELHQSGYDKIMQVPYMSGCFMFLRLEALQKVGFFDEKFFMYPEDIDLTRRIHKFYKTEFYPFAEVVHGYERGSYKSKKMLYIHVTNIIKYFNKWGWFFDNERKLANKKTLDQFK